MTLASWHYWEMVMASILAAGRAKAVPVVAPSCMIGDFGGIPAVIGSSAMARTKGRNFAPIRNRIGGVAPRLKPFPFGAPLTVRHAFGSAVRHRWPRTEGVARSTSNSRVPLPQVM
jgi:hypothetical protein